MLEEKRIDRILRRARRDDDLDVALRVHENAELLRTPRHTYRDVDGPSADLNAAHGVTVVSASDNMDMPRCQTPTQKEGALVTKPSVSACHKQPSRAERGAVPVSDTGYENVTESSR